MEWKFKSAASVTQFDGLGVLHALGTDFGQREYENPVTSGAVEVRFSQDGGNLYSDSQGRQGIAHKRAAEVVVAHTHEGDGVTQWSRGASDAWFIIDLKELLLVPTHYCYRGDFSGAQSQPRTWELQGSTDGLNWVTLRRHVKDQSVTRGTCGSWHVDGEKKGAYSMFRILNQGSPNRLCCSGFELYGKAVKEAPQATAASSPAASAPAASAPAACESIASRLSALRLDRSRARAAASPRGFSGGEPPAKAPAADAAATVKNGLVASRLKLVETAILLDDEALRREDEARASALRQQAVAADEASDGVDDDDDAAAEEANDDGAPCALEVRVGEDPRLCFRRVPGHRRGARGLSTPTRALGTST